MMMEGIMSVVTSPSCWALIALGTVIGLIFGAIPGLSAPMAMVLCLPMSFALEPVEGISLLIALYVGSTSGGLISAILLEIPGTPASIATVFDGGPMARNGEAGRALGIGILYSFIGGVISTVALVIGAKALASFALKFTPFEYFAIAVFSLTVIASLAGKSIIDGLISGVLGFLVAMVGMSPLGQVRFTFGNHNLLSGIDTVPILIGIYAIGAIISNAFGDVNKGIGEKKSYKLGMPVTWKEFINQSWNAIRSAVIGIVIGILPGIGGSTAGLLSYTMAKDSSKYPEKFGTGIIDGVVASETANNAVVGGSMIPLLTLGIPGSTPACLLLAGLTIHGITPGPLVFKNNGVFIYGLFAAVFIANIAFAVIETAGIKAFVKLLDIPKWILYPVIIAMCVIGAYANNNRYFDVILVFAFGLATYLLKKVGLNTTPFIIAYILGTLAETNLIRALSQSQGSWLPFITRPISAVMLAASVLSVALVIRKHIKAKRAGKEIEAGEED